MDSFFIFLFKSCFWISAFWIIYRLFLSNETFHAFNRWFLLAGLSLSFILPFFQFYYPKVVMAAPIEPAGWILTVIDEPVAVLQTATPTLGWIHLAVAIYAAVALSQLARSLMEVRRINRLIAKYGYTQHSGYRLVELDLPVAPFSFRNYIFINRDKITGMEAGVIIAHESAHIRQRHWIDLIAGSVLRIIQWINPFAFLLVRGMKENHEFMADKEVLAGGNSIAVYKAVLVNSSLGERVFTLGHPFSSSNNLKRHKMMNRKLSSASRKWSVLTILPLAALFFMAFAKPRYTTIETVPVHTAQQSATMIEGITPEHTPVDEPPVVTLQASDSITVTEEYLTALISDSITVTEEYLTALISDSITVKVNGSNTSVELHGQVQATVDSTRAFKAVKTDSTVVPRHFHIRMQPVTDPFWFNEVVLDTDVIPMILVDSIERSYEYVQNLNPDKIKAITVIKGEKLVAKYGAKGKNGVIVIETKAGTKKEGNISGGKGVSIMVGSVGEVIYNNAPDPLIIVDGHRVNKAILESLSEDKIQSIAILKGEDAVKLYGEEGRNGVIVIDL